MAELIITSWIRTLIRRRSVFMVKKEKRKKREFLSFCKNFDRHRVGNEFELLKYKLDLRWHESIRRVNTQLGIRLVVCKHVFEFQPPENLNQRLRYYRQKSSF
ncbi:hypothetical protein AMTRI_Chr08g160940 [Amborella trichopoda]